MHFTAFIVTEKNKSGYTFSEHNILCEQGVKNQYIVPKVLTAIRRGAIVHPDTMLPGRDQDPTSGEGIPVTHRYIGDVHVLW